MSDRVPSPNDEYGGRRPSEEVPPAMPFWVKAFALTAAAIAVALVVLMLVLGGDHGPGRHVQPAGSASPAAASTSERLLPA